MPTENNRKNWYLASICLAVIILGIIFYTLTANLSHILDFIRTVNHVLRPIYYGVILAFLLSPIHKYFHENLMDRMPIPNTQRRNSLSNGIAIFISLFLAFCLVYLLLAMVLPELYRSIEGLLQSIPQDFTFHPPLWLDEFFLSHPETFRKVEPYYEGIIMGINQWMQKEIAPSLSSVDGILSMVESLLLPNLSTMVSSISQFIAATVSFALDVVVAIIVSIYLLTRKKIFGAQAKKITYAFFPVVWGDLVLGETRNAYRILSGFINGKLIDSLIIGLICLVGANLLQLPYAPLIATVIGVTNIIPFFGPFIGAIPCCLLILLVSPIKCLYFIGFIIALQQFDGNILGPKILGESTGLASFWVLFSIILFGGIFGVPGMIFGVPVFANLYSMSSRFVKFLLKRKNLPQETANYEAYWDKFYEHFPNQSSK